MDYSVPMYRIPALQGSAMRTAAHTKGRYPTRSQETAPFNVRDLVQPIDTLIHRIK